MSSFIRRIQRTVKRDEDGILKSTRAHFGGRGSKLGYTNRLDPGRNRSLRKTPKPWRAKQHAPAIARLKISVAATPVRSTRADRKGLHVVKMARKKERNARVYQAFVAHYARAARASA